MSILLPLDIEYVINEKVDIIFEPILFTDIVGKELQKKTNTDILPLVDYVRAGLELRKHVSKGLNKKVYSSEIYKEIKKLVLCN